MLNREPTAILGGLSEIVRAIIPTLIIFGWIHWSGDQVAQVMLLVSVIVGFFSVLLTRSQVVPVEKANAQIEVAIAGPSTATVSEVVKKQEAQQ